MMRRIMILLALFTFLAVGSAWGQTFTDFNLYVCQSCTTPAGGDPNLITDTSAFNVGVAGNHSTVSPLLIIVGVPNGGSKPTVSYNGTDHNAGGTAAFGLNSTALAGTAIPFTASSTGDAVTQLGLNSGDSSDNFGNWSSYDKAGLGLTVTSFNLYVYELPATFSGNDHITIDLGGGTLGSYIMAYGCEQFSTTQCTGTGSDQVGQTPFTTTGDVVPEPATLTLLGTGLAGLAALVRRRRVAS